jgi:hypothetical protein
VRQGRSRATRGTRTGRCASSCTSRALADRRRACGCASSERWLNAGVLPTAWALAQHFDQRGAPDRIDASRPALLAQEFGGGRRTSADGSNQSELGLGRRTARPGALRARTPAQYPSCSYARSSTTRTTPSEPVESASTKLARRSGSSTKSSRGAGVGYGRRSATASCCESARSAGRARSKHLTLRSDRSAAQCLHTTARPVARDLRAGAVCSGKTR